MSVLHHPPSARRRAILLSVALWAFGLATTTLLVGVWGRSVAADTSTLRESALAMLDPQTVSEQVTDWAVTEIATVPGIPGSTMEVAIRAVADSPAARVAVSSVVSDVIDAANAAPGTETEIDVAGAIEPLRPVLITALEEAGHPAAPADIDAYLRQIEGLVLSSAEQSGSARGLSTARSALTTVMFVGAGALLLFGAAAVRLSEDRTQMLRSLANRLIVSALTFALFLRIGAWAVDPRGGRSPLRESGAIVLSSNLGEVLSVAVAGLAISMIVTVGIGRVRRSRTAIRRESSAPTSSPNPEFTEPAVSLEEERRRASALSIDR